MTQIINLRRIRKNKRRATKASAAEANRAKHGIAKPVRTQERLAREKTERAIDGHRLDDKK